MLCLGNGDEETSKFYIEGKKMLLGVYRLGKKTLEKYHTANTDTDHEV